MSSSISSVSRCVIWAAVSSESQARDEKASIPDQLRLGREAAALHGLTVVAELIVPGQSRSIVLFEDACKKIAAYAQLHRMIQGKEMDVFIFLNRSRLGRISSLSMTVAELLREAGIICYDLESPPATLTADDSHDGMLTGAIKSVGAQREIITLQHRHKIGMLARTENGRWPAKVPWGWLGNYATSVDGKRILISEEVDPVASAHIRRALLEWYLRDGMSQKMIAEKFNEAGVPTPTGKRWEHAHVAHLFNLVLRFAGYSEINKRSTKREYVRAKGNWPPILTLVEAEAILAERARRVHAPRTVSHVTLFSGVVWCQRCNRPMSAATDKGFGHAYRCNHVNRFGAHADGQTKRSLISYNKLMEAAIEAITEIQDASTRAEIIAARIQPQGNDATAQLAALDARLKRLEAAQQRIDRDYYIDERVDITRHRALSDDIQRQISELARQHSDVEQQAQVQQAAANLADDLADIASVGLAKLAMPVREANAWLRRSLRIYMLDCEAVQVDFLPRAMP